MSLQELLSDFYFLLNLIVPLIMGLALVFFLWGTSLFILNSGNEEKRSEGKQKMFWGVVALAVMVGVWGLVNLLVTAFGIEDVFPR